MSECPYCLEAVAKPYEAVVCKSCGAAYHQECWFENGGCCVTGCKSARRVVELDIPQDEGNHISISSEAAQKAVPHKAERNWNPCLKCGRHVPARDLYCRDCKPKREPSEDYRNVGPLLIMLALLALLLGAIVVMGNLSGERPGKSNRPGIETRMLR